MSSLPDKEGVKKFKCPTCQKCSIWCTAKSKWHHQNPFPSRPPPKTSTTTTTTKTALQSNIDMQGVSRNNGNLQHIEMLLHSLATQTVSAETKAHLQEMAMLSRSLSPTPPHRPGSSDARKILRALETINWNHTDSLRSLASPEQRQKFSVWSPVSVTSLLINHDRFDAERQSSGESDLAWMLLATLNHVISCVYGKQYLVTTVWHFHRAYANLDQVTR